MELLNGMSDGVCEDDDFSGCPFAFTEYSEQIQSYGCLPSPHEIIQMRIKSGKTWACHMAPNKPCVGAIKHLKEHNLPHKVIDPVLVTEQDDWGLFT